MPANPPEVWAITAESGGDGKTTTCVNLGAAISRVEPTANVLLTDMDGQEGSLTHHVGLGRLDDDEEDDDAYKHSRAHDFPNYKNPDGPVYDDRPTLKEVLQNRDDSIEDLLVELPHYDVVPAASDLANLEIALLTDQRGAERFRLRKELETIADRYDYILIDTPGSTGQMATDNAIFAARQVLAPIQLTEKGKVNTRGLEDTVDLVTAKLQDYDPTAEATLKGVIPNMVEGREDANNIYNIVRDELLARDYVVPPVGIRKRDCLKYAWRNHMNIYEYHEHVSELTGYKQSVLRKYETIAKMLTGQLVLEQTDSGFEFVDHGGTEVTA